MGVADQVDVCVTCVSDKPPKLPLREELVSLGVEVILNGHGVGAKAVKHETRKQVREFRKEFEKQNKSSIICFPWKSQKQKMQEKRELKQMEKELKRRHHGLSYARYSKALNGETSSIFDSDSSWNTHSTGSTSHDSEKHGGVRRATFLKRRNERPDHVSDAAVASAFADLNAANLLKESKVSKSELPTSIAFKPRKDKAKYEQDDASAGLGAYSFLSGNESVQQNTKSDNTQKNARTRSSSDMTIYGKWDVVATGEVSVGNSSSDGSVYTSSEDGTNKKSESLSLEGAIHKETRKANRMESMLGLPEVTSPRSEPLLFESSGMNGLGSASPPFKEFIHDSEDEDSFILDDGSASIGLPSVEGASTTSETVSVVSRKKKEHVTLLSALSQVCAPRTSELPDFVNCDTNVVPQPGATSPLHEACNEKFPDRLVSPGTNILDIADKLTKDITQRMEKLHFITNYLSHSCMMENRDGDLPVHLLARRLVEWEASWQERLKLVEVEAWSDTTKFTQLHKLMGVCVDQVLNPMVRNRLACRSRGKLGTRILPLHAAAMFAVPFDTIQALLESYPEAAQVACELGHLHTNISNNLLPLQLLERKRSDFVSSPTGRLLAKPSGDEIEPLAHGNEDDDGIKWTKSTLCSTNIADDLIRRSDLIFAFNPNILPFRRDAVRMKRIELIIRAEAQVAMARRTKALEPTARAAWTWICTFDEPLDEDDTYVDVVGRIVNALDVPTVEFLAALDTPEGTILTTAQHDCAKIIQLKLNGEQIEQYTTKPPSFSPQSSDQNDATRHSILKSPKAKAEPAYISEGEICRNELCREVFNIREQRIPTNFILLPYELTKNEDGSFGLASPDSASIALQFATCLTDLTQPWHVNHILEKKAVECLGHKLTVKRATGFQTFDWRSKNMIRELQRLFQGKGYLYLLDEESGGPIVSAPSDTNPIAAIVVEKPVEAIHNLLPLILMGMIRMRGDRSIVLIIETMISGKRAPPERWITIMQNITRHLYSRGSKLSTDEKERKELLALSEALSDFVARTTKRNTTRRPESDDGGEWSSEISHLKRILEGSTVLAATGLPNALSTNRQEGVVARIKATVTEESLNNNKEQKHTPSEGTKQQDDPLLQGSNKDFDKIWAPEDDHSLHEAKDQQEPEVSKLDDSSSKSESCTSFLEGDILPERPEVDRSSHEAKDQQELEVSKLDDSCSKSESCTSFLEGDILPERPEVDRSSHEAKDQQELEVSKLDDSCSDSEAFTAFSDGDKLPEPIYKTSSEDDSEKRRDMIIWNGELNRKEEQMTAIVNHSDTLTKPPRVPRFSTQLTEDKEKKLMEIKLRLNSTDSSRFNEDPSFNFGQEYVKKDVMVAAGPLLIKDQEEHDSHVDDTRDDFSNDLFSRLLGLEERIQNREGEIEELRRDVCSFERKAADAIYESLSRDDESALSNKDDSSSSFTSTEGTTIVSDVSKHETDQSPSDDGAETSAPSLVLNVRTANPRFVTKEASDDDSSQSSSSSTFQNSTYSSITSVASSFPKRKATFTFEGASSTYVSSSSDEASVGKTDDTSASSSAAAEEESYGDSGSEKGNAKASLTTDDDSSDDSSSFDGSRNNHTLELKDEGNILDKQDMGIPPTVFSSDDLDLLLKSFSVDDGPNVPGNPFSGDEQDSHQDVPGNPFSGDEQDAHQDVPGNPFSGDEQDAHQDVPGNPFSGDEQDAHQDVPGNPFSGDEQDAHEDVPGNPFSGDEQDAHQDVPGNPFSGDEEDSFGKSNISSDVDSDVDFVLSSQGKAMIQI